MFIEFHTGASCILRIIATLSKCNSAIRNVDSSDSWKIPNAACNRPDAIDGENGILQVASALRGVTGGGATNTKPESDFLKGFDSDEW